MVSVSSQSTIASSLVPLQSSSMALAGRSYAPGLTSAGVAQPSSVRSQQSLSHRVKPSPLHALQPVPCALQVIAPRLQLPTPLNSAGPV